MKQIFKVVFATLLVGITTAHAAAPYFSIRSQGVNAARELVGWQNHINLPDKDSSYACFSFTPEFTRSFRPGSIACCLFSPHITDCNCPMITISGRDVANRGDSDWMADYFGLPGKFKSRLQFEPYIRNFNIDFNLFVGLDGRREGLFFRVHSPLTHTKWGLNMCESIDQKSTAGYDPGYFDTVDVTRKNLLTNATEFFVDGKAPTLTNVTFQPLKYNKFPKCALTKTRLADIEMALGYNFKLDEDYHVGAALRWSIPTGNKPEGIYLFEPIVGSGGHWKLGAGFTSHYCFWRDDETDRNVGFWFDLNLQHLFKAKQCRTFDLCRKPNSRYMLAQKLGANSQELQGGGQLSDYQFANEFAPVANLTTTQVKVSAALEADMVLKFVYTHDCVQWDLGYELWARSCEKICAQCPVFAGKTWALKGDGIVYGYVDEAGDGTKDTPLAATEKDATINKGTRTSTGDPNNQNIGIDNAQLAIANNSTGNVQAVRSYPNAANQMYTSMQPVILKDSDIDYGSARTRGISHKIFTHFNYTWLNYDEDWTPFCGVGASVEFHRNKCCDGKCSTPKYPSSPCDCEQETCCINECTPIQKPTCADECCADCALNQWAIWFKGGIAFN